MYDIISLSDLVLACGKYKQILTFKQGKKGSFMYI